MTIVYLYLVCFIFSISYSVLPFHLVYVLQFLHLFFFYVLPQGFLSTETLLYTYIFTYKCFVYTYK